MNDELIVLLAGNEVGHVRRDQRGRLRFVYNDAWRESRGAYPLSLSMPLAGSDHSHDVVDTFIWGLLPDSEYVIRSWAQRFQVSARSAFALISHVGEDCAGAVQFVRPGRLHAVQNAGPDNVDWIGEAAIAARLKALRDDHAAWRRHGDTGQFTLGGAQPKTALLFQDGEWGVPSGWLPTTHILKPPTGTFNGHAENEHFCLELARALDLPAASSTVQHFGEESAFVVERYDRCITDKGILRIHQEDMCQSFGLPPTRKYENEGGPSVTTIANFLRDYSSAPRKDVQTFLDAVAFNWLIGGTDAHAKNYSILIGGAGRTRLAPIYDLASLLPYADIDLMKIKLAMKLGGKYRIQDITARNWFKLSEELHLDKDEVLQRVCTMAKKLPAEADAIRKELAKAGMKHPVIERLAEALGDHAGNCVRLLSEANSECFE